MTKEELLDLAMSSQKPQWRNECTVIPPGLSLTRTERSEYWRYREGDTIYFLRLRRDEEPYFEIQHRGENDDDQQHRARPDD